MTSLRIAMFNVSETMRDPRVRRIAGTLAAQGHDVTVLGPTLESRTPNECVDQFTIRRLHFPGFPTLKDLQAQVSSLPNTRRVLESCEFEALRLPLEQCLSVPGVSFCYRAVNKLLRMFPRVGRLLGKSASLAATYHGEIIGIRRILMFNAQLCQAALTLKPNVVHCNDLNTLLAGLMVKEMTGARLVYDAHEIYPEQFDDATYTSIWKNFYTRLEKELLPFTDLRMTVCDSLGEYFQRRYGSETFVTVRNVPSARLRAPAEILRRRNQPRKILYHGGYFPHRGLEQVIQAAAMVPDALFILRGIGGHESALRRLVADLKLHDHVQFAPPVTVNELIHHASDCDIGLNPFIPVCKNTEYALPNKFFEYLSAGLAVASTDLIEMRRLTERHRLGILFDATKPEKIASALRDLLADEVRLEAYRRNAYEAAQDHFFWERECDRLISAYEGLVAAAAA